MCLNGLTGVIFIIIIIKHLNYTMLSSLNVGKTIIILFLKWNDRYRPETSFGEAFAMGTF